MKSEDGKKTVGVVTAKNVMYRLGKSQLKLSDPITRCVVRDLRHVSKGMTLNEMTRVLNRNDFVLVEDKYFLEIQDVFDAMHARKAVLPVTPVKEVVVEAVKKPVFVESADLAAAQDTPCSNSKMFLGAVFGAMVGAATCFMVLKHK